MAAPVLRPFQVEVLARVEAEIAAGRSPICVVSPSELSTSCVTAPS
jgi:hypothetical protein